MLVLSRRKNEGVAIGDHVTVTVVEIRGDKVRLSVTAPREMPVHRQEVWVALYGPPLSTGLDPAWLAWQDGAVVRLARSIAEKEDYEALPILADALEEAGCTDTEILHHCRSRSHTLRRSWVVDLILSVS